jgi:DNA-binding NarL/FixJ family response regulator
MKIRVVVADDFPLVREGVVRALNSDPGIEVVAQAENGTDALRVAEELRPDVMILDLRMPDLGGLAVLDKLRTSRPEIRIIVMTASE